jgi:hypothetical protein
MRIVAAFLLVLSLSAQVKVSLTPYGGGDLRWAVEARGQAGTTLARADIVVGAPVAFLLRDAAADRLRRVARDSRQARLSSAAPTLLTLCSAGASYAVTRIHHNGLLAVGTAAAGAVCAIVGLTGKRLDADRYDPASDIAHLLPDSGVTLPWSGLLVAARPGGEAVTLEVH